MSRNKRIATLYKDEQSLRMALDELCATESAAGHTMVYEYHAVPQMVLGIGNKPRPEQANFIIRQKYVGSSSNDMGWCWNEEKQAYDLIISDWDSTKYGMRFANKLKPIYTKHDLLRRCKAKGLMLQSSVEKDGKLLVTMTGMR